MNIFKCTAVYESKKPLIDFDNPINRLIDWGLIGDVLDGDKPIALFPKNIHIKLDFKKYDSWDAYPISGTLGLFSEKFITVSNLINSGYFAKFPVQLNSTTYFFISCITKLDCLDYTLSKFTNNVSSSRAMRRILHYHFDYKIICEAEHFCLPDEPDLFIIERIANLLNDSAIKGVRIEPLP